MIKAQYNIVGFYTSKAARQWDRFKGEGHNEELFRVFLPTNKIPAVQVIVDSASTATIQLFNTDDTAISSVLNMTVEAGTGYKRLIYAGTTLTGKTDGDYYLKIVNTIGVGNTETYYSDVFGWTSDSDDLNDLLKISAVSSDFRAWKNYNFNMTGITHECYVNAEYLGLTPEFEDEIVKRDGANNIVYGTLTLTRTWEVYACEYIYKFLLGLRILESNGTVTVTWKGNSYTANDILAEKGDEYNIEAFLVKFSFVDNNEILNVNNENS